MVAQAEMFRRREFRRLATISVVFHGVAFLIFMWDPIPRRLPAMPSVVEVQFVAPPSGPKALPPAAKPTPKPAPKPKPKPPVAKKVVLPAKPKPLEAPRPKPKPEVAKPKPKPEPKKPEPKPEVKPEPKPEAGYEDVLAQLRAKHGETAVKPKAQAAPAPVTGVQGGRVGARLSPEEAAWRSRLRIHLRQSWVLAPGFRLQQLSTQVRVRLDSRGNLIGEPRIERGSGNPWYDDSTIRAVEKASPLPAPPNADTYIIEFRPEDYF
jgi:colicin import membrane protein